MQDYTTLGIEKIAQQAAKDPTLIRCPRDSAVMRVLRTRPVDLTADDAGADQPPVSVNGARSPIELDVECPACRRRATAVRTSRRQPPARAAQQPIRDAVSRRLTGILAGVLLLLVPLPALAQRLEPGRVASASTAQDQAAAFTIAAESAGILTVAVRSTDGSDLALRVTDEDGQPLIGGQADQDLGGEGGATESANGPQGASGRGRMESPSDRIDVPRAQPPDSGKRHASIRGNGDCGRHQCRGYGLQDRPWRSMPHADAG